MIKIVILDVDGVLTDGRKYYDQSGLATHKTFCDKDFTAIKKFKSVGCDVIFLSGDKNINEKIAENRNIPFYYTRGECKSKFLPTIMEKFKCKSDEMVFVGDDLFDLEIMKMVKYKFCPKDSPTEVKEVCQVLTTNGGCNCVLEVYETLYMNSQIPLFDINEIYKLDEKEKF